MVTMRWRVYSNLDEDSIPISLEFVLCMQYALILFDRYFSMIAQQQSSSYKVYMNQQQVSRAWISN